MTTTLLLLRHASRIPLPNIADRECPISELGKEETLTIAKQIQALGYSLDKIFFSPTKRTEETAAVYSALFHIEAECEPLLQFSADETQLFSKVEKGKTIAFVGHGPSLGAFAQLACASLPLQGEMATSSAIILQFPNEIGRGKAQFIKYFSN